MFNLLKLYKLINKRISVIFTTIIFFLNINTTYYCDNNKLDLTIRNNINGDFSIIDSVSQIKPGSFINISWKNNELMLPLSPRKGFLSFSDKNWDFRYNIKDNNNIEEEEPVLYELLPSNQFIEHKCNIKVE